MKIFTNRRVSQKIVIALLTVLILTFAIPKPVSADVGGVLVSPVTALLTVLIDSIQWGLEWIMLGRSNYFMDQTLDSVPASSTPNSEATIKVTQKIDGAFLTLDRANVPDIKYTPENIFANRIPALDVNFINPSVKTGSDQWDQEHNIAMKLGPIIAGWYVGLRILALVGLLSVLVYLGIRMLLTSIAEDRAKYKKMIMDWLVAVCLLFVLHYIMSFALTMSEVVTSMITQDTEKMVSVYIRQEGKTIDMSLMNYVRFMIQCTDFKEKIAFLFLYLMLMIYTIRFTWTYLKRVVNMAFLTLIAPFVALTYPIDRVTDGKAQAFSMWIKEFGYNALLQPLHLLLYTVLLTSAAELAVINPLYAIVCLGFIMSAEKLLKSMFGFNKAGAGTVGSLAGAAAVSTLAGRGLMALTRPRGGKGGGPGKVRTSDRYQREGRDNGANKGYNTFDSASNQGQAQLDSGTSRNVPQPTNGETNRNAPQPISSESRNNVPPPPGENGRRSGENIPESESAIWTPDSSREYEPAGLNRFEEDEYNKLSEGLEDSGLIDENGQQIRDFANEQEEKDFERYSELYDKNKEREQYEANNQPEPIGDEDTQEAIRNLGPEPETWQQTMERIHDELDEEKAQANRRPTKASMREADMKEKEARRQLRDEERSRRRRELGLAVGTKAGRKELGRRFEVGAYGTIKGVKAAAGTMAYKAVRGTVKAVPRAVIGGALAATAGVIGATTGDGEKALGAVGTAGFVGAGLGGKLFEGSLGKLARDNRTVKDSYGAAKYGSAIEARNKEADKEYLRSAEHEEEYEKYFKTGANRMSKKEYDRAVLEYRRVGITSKKDIRNALKLEQQYKKDGKNHGSDQEIRGKVQNIVQTYDNVNKRAVYGEDEKATEAALRNIEGLLSNVSGAKQRRAVANEILQGYRDWYNI